MGKKVKYITFILMIIYAICMAAATIVEKYYGSEVAFGKIYHSFWFIFLQFLLGFLLIVFMIKLKLFRGKTWSSFFFHFSFLIILSGALITHLFGFEGILHVRENDKVDYIFIGKEMELKEIPFTVELINFSIERYPGSKSPSSFSSNIKIFKDDILEEKNISVNNVLDINGYRIFQTSYDEDERGSVFTVNYDKYGQPITYCGYFLLITGMFINLFSKKSRFRMLLSQLKNSNYCIVLLVLILSTFNLNLKAENINPKYLVSKDDAERFGKMAVQNPKGRLEPMNSWSEKILRKVSNAKKFQDIESDQFLLSLLTYPYEWSHVDFIRIKNKDILNLIGKNGKYINYMSLFDRNGDYILHKEVENAYRCAPAKRTKFENDLLKLDEIVNILNLLFDGQFLAIFPNDKDESGKWYSCGDDLSSFSEEDKMFVSKIMDWYILELHKGNSEQANEVLDMIGTYQDAKSTILIDKIKLEREIKYNKADIFSRIIKFYLLIGVLILIVSFIQLQKKSGIFNNLGRGLIVIALIVFIYHSYGLILRWLISEHAPWTNSYESIVYLAWCIILIGLISSFYNRFITSLSVILGGVLLFVASLNNMNPEITPLVPVLQSIWLLFHVAIIMVGYGFFFISALIGLLNITTFAFAKYTEKIEHSIKELTIMNELFMILGLIFMTTGCFLGAIWANESWGRYWGWDPKETWALISIIIYAIILHLRIFPGWKDIFIFNLLSLYGVSTILMTYFGVNIYLSGMHSYGNSGGNLFSYLFLGISLILTIISLLAYKKYSSKRFSQKF